MTREVAQRRTWFTATSPCRPQRVIKPDKMHDRLKAARLRRAQNRRSTTEPSRSQKRCRLSQPWETAVARQVVLTPTGPRPALTRADLIVTLAAAVEASDADASVPREITWISNTGPAPSESPTSCQGAPGAERGSVQESVVRRCYARQLKVAYAQ
jgi:hypothetical protein